MIAFIVCLSEPCISTLHTAIYFEAENGPIRLAQEPTQGNSYSYVLSGVIREDKFRKWRKSRHFQEKQEGNCRSLIL